MKKYIFSVVTIFLMLLPIKVLATNSDLILDPEVLKNKGEVYSSITDMYGTAIFSDKYKEDNEKKIKEEIDKKNKLLNNLFLNEAKNNEKYLRSNEKDFLFKNKKTINNKIEINKKTNYSSITLVIIVLIISISIIVITNRFYKNKRDKEEDNYAYYNNRNK